jgi:hypothetical protein
MSHDDSGHCFFVLQPTSGEEVNSAIRATWASCCRAIRYGGNDPEILSRFAELGESSLCDNPAPSIKPVRRNQARFEYCSPKNADEVETARLIIEIIVTLLPKRQDTECTAFRHQADSSSFQFVWGKSESLNDNKGYSIRIRVRHEKDSWWLLSLSENDQGERGIAIQLDNALRQCNSIRAIRWFSSSELSSGDEIGRSRPY